MAPTTRKTPSARPISKVSDQPSGKPKSTLTVDEKSEAERAHELELEAEALLADMPALKPPHKLRIRERNRLMTLVINADLLNADETAAINAEELAPEDMSKMLDLIAGVDEFAESIAADPDAYAEWAEGKDFDVFMAIMNRYSVALGK